MRAFVVSGEASDEEAIVTRLWESGTAGLEERPCGPDGISFISYFDDGNAVAVASLFADMPGVTIEPTDIPDVDWMARFRENFRAFDVGTFLIAPAWNRPEHPPAGRRLLVVDPGRAFGTGTHESTALCLAALESVAATRALGRTLDVGTGSGILAVAAFALGATAAIASDIDPESLDSARTHARLNDSALLLVHGDGGRPFRRGTFDTVLANITAPLLIERAAELLALPRAGGRLILAGLLQSDRESVAAAYERAGAGAAASASRREWASLVVEKK